MSSTQTYITTSQTPTDAAVTLSGGIIFIIIFLLTSLFFLFIMTLVCCGEFKDYRTRGSRRVGHSEKEKINKTDTTSPDNDSQEKQKVEDEDESSEHEKEKQQNIYSTEVAIIDLKHHGPPCITDNHIRNSGKTIDAIELPVSGRKKTELSPLSVTENSTVVVADIDHPFSPTAPKIIQTVGFLDQPPLPSIKDKKSSSDLPHVN